MQLKQTTRVQKADAYLLLNEYDQARKEYFEYIRDSKTDTTSYNYVSVHNDLSISYLKQKDYKKSIEWGEKALLLASDYNFVQLEKDILWNLSECYLNLGDYDKAKLNYNLLNDLDIADKNENDYLLGKIAFNKKQYQKSKQLFLAYITNKNRKGNLFLIDSYEYLSESYLKNNEYDSAISARDEYFRL